MIENMPVLHICAIWHSNQVIYRYFHSFEFNKMPSLGCRVLCFMEIKKTGIVLYPRAMKWHSRCPSQY